MNPWQTFVQLMSTNKRWIGKVITSSVITKKVTVQEVGATGSIIVDSNGGSFPDNSFVFIEGSMISGVAPEIAESVDEIVY